VGLAHWFKRLIKTYSLRSQIIVSFGLLTILSVTIIGLTALWTNYRYLETEKRQQSVEIVRSFYQVQETNIGDMIILAASFLTKDYYDLSKDLTVFSTYLKELHRGVPKIDSISVCDQTGAIIASSGTIVPISTCNLESNPHYKVISQDGQSQVWLLRGRKIFDQSTESGSIVFGIHLDDQFLMEMCDHCDLYHSILQNGKIIATSFGSKLSQKANLHALTSRFADVEFKESFIMGDHEYYISNFPISGTGLEVEVAIDITSIRLDQRQQELFLTIVILFVVLIAILFGSFLAQIILSPLSQLVAQTNQFEELDLSRPIYVNTKLQEVKELSQVLEDSRNRINLTLTSLQKETQWSELLLESIVEGIIILLDGKIDYFSPGAERITGWKQEEVIGISIDNVLVASDQSSPCFSIDSPPGEKIRCKFILKNNEVRILSITHAQLLMMEDGKPQTVLVLRDVNQEEELSHLLGSFLGNITHEFRTPLSALAASIEILMDEAENLEKSEMKELLNSIHLSTINLENLIDNLLEGSSIETGRFRVNPSPSDIGNVILTTCDTINPLLKKYGQKLKIELPKKLPIVMIDEKRISQVLLNILANASKYGPKDEDIYVTAVISKNQIEIKIGDRGTGVPEPYREKIFSGYVLANNVGGKIPTGTGLGLSVSQTIIKAHGGQMGVRDRRGGGSEFWFTIPIKGGK
jgi:PAS domain S-box-containing protein